MQSRHCEHTEMSPARDVLTDDSSTMGNAVVTARGVSGVWKRVEGIRLHVHPGPKRLR